MYCLFRLEKVKEPLRNFACPLSLAVASPRTARSPGHASPTARAARRVHLSLAPVAWTL